MRRTEAPCMSCGQPKEDPPRNGGILMRCLNPANHHKPEGTVWLLIDDVWRAIPQ